MDKWNHIEFLDLYMAWQKDKCPTEEQVIEKCNEYAKKIAESLAKNLNNEAKNGQVSALVEVKIHDFIVWYRKLDPYNQDMVYSDWDLKDKGPIIEAVNKFIMPYINDYFEPHGNVSVNCISKRGFNFEYIRFTLKVTLTSLTE